ncbi:phenylacetate--CoA ligase family protein [Sulfitobacter porphyrae]|uniref:Phenylacetate--CoA ligase family protein n=1 Tax=Sulfitobacter porphyrae TaxID=1246864 RepID=A0ABW2B9N7_9RHOB
MTIQKLLATRDDAIAREDAPAYLAALDAIRLARIPAQIDHCIGNEFYGPKLRDAGINRGADIKTMEDFRRLPAFMTKADHRASQQASLEKYGHSFGLHTCVPKESIIHVAGTSGTTGMPTFYLFTRRDLDMTYEMVGRMLKKAGVRPGDTVLHLFGLSMWLGGTTFMQSLEAYGAHPIPLGAEAGVSRALQYLAACRPRVIAGTPSFLSYLIDRAPEELGKLPAHSASTSSFAAANPAPRSRRCARSCKRVTARRSLTPCLADGATRRWNVAESITTGFTFWPMNTASGTIWSIRPRANPSS